jgi:hypothetical protein
MAKLSVSKTELGGSSPSAPAKEPGVRFQGSVTTLPRQEKKFDSASELTADS